MPEVQPYRAPYPNAVVGWTGAIWHCLSVDATGQLQIDVLSTVMDAAAATAANQAALQVVIEGQGGHFAVQWASLLAALQSVNTDALQVRGEDQLFSFKGVLAETRTAAISGADGYVNSIPCAAGEIWCVTNAYANDLTSPTTRHAYDLRHDGASYGIGEVVAAIAAGDGTYWNGWVWLDPADTIRVYFVGGLAGDSCIVRLTGYRMTLEA